jgi:hypothetical protein
MNDLVLAVERVKTPGRHFARLIRTCTPCSFCLFSIASNLPVGSLPPSDSFAKQIRTLSSQVTATLAQCQSPSPATQCLPRVFWSRLMPAAMLDLSLPVHVAKKKQVPSSHAGDDAPVRAWHVQADRRQVQGIGTDRSLLL